MTRRTTLATTALAVVLAASALGATPAVAATSDPGAATDLSWGIQPSTPDGPDGRADLSYQVAPGTVISDWISVTNYSAVATTFRVYAADATTDYDTAAFTLVNADEPSRDAGTWTAIDGGVSSCPDEDTACLATLGITVALDPGARADIPFAITVPQDATPGDHAAGIVASVVSGAVAEGGTGVSVEQRVGTRIYLRVDGALTPSFGVSGAVAGYDGGINPFSGTTRLGFDLTNTGNTRVSAAAEARLTGPFGIPLATVTLPVVTNLVPGGVGHVAADVDGIPPLLLLFADLTVTGVPADGIAATDPIPAAVSASVVTWAVPWMLLLAIVVIVGAVVVTVWLRRRSRERLAEDLAAYAEQVRADERAHQGAFEDDREVVR